MELNTCDWMQSLAAHYGRVRQQYPEKRLLILFDIDGTILDMRQMVRHVLLWFDRVHETQFFHGLEAEDITVHENQLETYLKERSMTAADRDRVAAWYKERRWSQEAILEAHRPYRGVMEVIRWFQIQPLTEVGLNTGRPERLRSDTLRSLNTLGREHRVEFDDALLAMNPHDWEQQVADCKAASIEHFRQLGYQVFAVVDNEPANIHSMQSDDVHHEILFLHADTLFESRPRSIPRTVSGRSYDLTNLLSQQDLPQHVQFAWHGINDRANLRQFIASHIQWGECDVRRDPLDRIVLRHDSFEETPWDQQEKTFLLADCLKEIQQHGRGIKIDLKEGGDLLGRLLPMIDASGLEESHLWFNGNIEILGEAGFRQLAATYPHAVRQCPVDFLVPLVLAMPHRARQIFDELTEWGMNRFSLSWQIPEKRAFIECVQSWGIEVNIYGVDNLEHFLQAALLLPRSLTSDFNFPQWHYYGRGAGQKGNYHQYGTVHQGPESNG